MRAAAQRTAIWIVLSLLFNLVVWKIRGPDKALEFLTGYVIEYSLSVDNIFIFVLIFAYFQVPPQSQHRALVWGIVGALVMRGAIIWPRPFGYFWGNAKSIKEKDIGNDRNRKNDQKD